MMDVVPTGLLGVRDRALLPLGFAGGFRRSELVALDVVDLKFVPEGLEALVRRSKTDQEGEGLTKVVAYGSDPAHGRRPGQEVLSLATTRHRDPRLTAWTMGLVSNSDPLDRV